MAEYHGFFPTLVAAVTGTSPADWKITGVYSWERAELLTERRHGNDVFAITVLTANDGRVAQVEQDSCDWVFVDSGNANWAGVLEDNVVVFASSSFEKCREAFLAELSQAA